MATEPTTLTQPHDCGRSIASIVQEIDALKAENERLRGHLQFAVDAVRSEARYQWEQDRRGITCAQYVAQRMGVVATVIRNAVGGDL